MVQVTVSEGVLQGEVVDNEYGGQFYSFKGIPYAAPPVGDLRFKAPQPALPWKGVRSAKEHGQVCFQHDLTLSPEAPYGSEDCLYLNVYSPDVKPVNPVPVMVWIHGGAFVWGSGNDNFFSPEFLVKRGVVLVTINYRLGALGFLSLGTEDIPGNAGMKDQVAALRWVQQNIRSFGGNPDNVTIFGESAGGASVSYHLVSPMSNGLFRRAIAQSGSVTNSWAQAFVAREKALLLAKKLGFTSEDNKELYNFFKTLPVEKFIDVSLPVIKSASPNDIDFSVVREEKFGNDERFFYGDECDLLRNGIHEGVDVMTGYTKDEGLLVLADGRTMDEVITEANTYAELFVPAPIRRECPIKVQLDVGNLLRKHYLENNVASAENFDRILQYFDLHMFVHGVVLFGKLCAKKSNVFFYKVTCISERNILSRLLNVDAILKGRPVVCHADDVMYLFPAKFANLKLVKGSEAEKLVDQITTLWTNFAKFGNPTPDDSLGVRWTPITADQHHYLDIGNELVLRKDPDGEDIAFWNDIMKKYVPHWSA